MRSNIASGISEADDMVVIATGDQQMDLGHNQLNSDMNASDMEGYDDPNGGEDMVVIAADENVDINQLQQLIQSGNIILANDDNDDVMMGDGDVGEDTQVIQLTTEQTNLLNSGVPLEQILSTIPGISGQICLNDYGGAVTMSTGIGIPGVGNPNGVTYRCPSCPTMYVNANAFTKHMREKHFVRVYTCRNCPEFFDSLSNLFLHARRSHVDPKRPKKNPAHFKFHCETCGYMTNNGGTMEHHKRAHTGEKPYACDICGKRFAQKANMKTHRNRHTHTEKVFRCDTCNKGFASHDIYLAHLRTREHELREHYALISSSSLQLECLGCRNVFDNVYLLNKHYRGCQTVRNLQMKFRCILCDVLLEDLISLKSHVKQHEGVTSIGCPVCGERGFPGFNQLNHHITRAHALKVNRRHVCRYCESTYENKHDLDEHVKQMHSDERNARQSRGSVGRLRCNYLNCDFTTNSIMLLDRHHGQHQQLEEDGLDANQANLPPARNETRGPRKTLLRPLHAGYSEPIDMLDENDEDYDDDDESGINSRPLYLNRPIRGRGRGRPRTRHLFDQNYNRNTARLYDETKKLYGLDSDDQSDWEAEFQEELARESQVKQFGSPQSSNEENMAVQIMPRRRGRPPKFPNNRSAIPPHSIKRERVERNLFSESLISRIGSRDRRLPSKFRDYDTDIGAPEPVSSEDKANYLAWKEKQRKISQAKQEATFSSYPNSNRDNSFLIKQEPLDPSDDAVTTFTSIYELVSSGLTLLQPNVIIEDYDYEMIFASNKIGISGGDFDNI